MEPPISAKAALLQALVKGPGYGLDLMERVKTATNGRLILGFGSIYPALRDLERAGLIEGYEGEPRPERGGRPPIFYRLSAEGARVVVEHRETILGLFALEGA